MLKAVLALGSVRSRSRSQYLVGSENSRMSSSVEASRRSRMIGTNLGWTGLDEKFQST